MQRGKTIKYTNQTSQQHFKRKDHQEEKRVGTRKKKMIIEEEMLRDTALVLHNHVAQ